MAAKIKLKRMGKKKRPFYRVIVQDESSSRRGRAIEEIGIYNPVEGKQQFEVEKDKVLDWLSKGAQPTEKVRILLGKAGILPAVSFEGKPRRKPKSKGEEAAEGAAPAPEAASSPAPAPSEKPAEKKEEPKPEAQPKEEAQPKDEPKKEEAKPAPGEAEGAEKKAGA